ncbi:Deoxyribonuclease-1 [Schistosoma japonicum]|nr:Deoxyribonuclease-1 [Schistosoma japonicum]
MLQTVLMYRTFLLFISCSLIYNECVTIGSFNIQVFGRKKMSQKDVVKVLIQILSRYDLVVIQEIRDSKNTSFKQLVNVLNEHTGGIYASILSEKLGRTYSKEQYGLIYKTKLFSVGEMVTFPHKKNLFERPPMAVQIFTKFSEVKMFGLIVVHLDPDSVFQEANDLYNFVNQVMKIWNTQDLIILGDMNADCGYLSRKKMEQLHLRKDTKFTWIIPDKYDTTLGKGDCAYDRIIIHGKQLKQAIKPGSAKAYQFPIELKINNQLAKQVSDHYPVEMVMN